MGQTEALVVSISEKGALVVQRNIAAIGTTAKTTGKSVGILKKALGGFAALGIAVGLSSAIKLMASFGQEMSTAGAITGAVGKEFDDLREKAKALGTNTRFSATQAAEGMTFLARAGFNTNQVLDAIGPTLQLAQAGALGLGAAADIASNVLTGFNIAATESQRVMDVLALSANSSNTNVQQLGQAMSFVAPIAASLKVGLEETSAAIEILSNAGIQASRAGTNLTMVMRLMQSPTTKQANVLKDLNLSLADVDVGQIGLTKSLENMNAAGIGTTQIFKFFGRSAAAAAVLLRGANGQIQEFTQANKEAEGTAKGVAEAMDKNLNGALLAVKSAFEGLVLAFGDLGTESILTRSFLSLAKSLRIVATNLKLTTQLLAAFGVAFAAVKYAAFLQGLSQTVVQFVALQQAAAAGTVTILGSAQADAAKAVSALATAQAEAKKTMAIIASTRAQATNTVVVAASTTTEVARATVLKQVSVLEAKHAIQLQAVSVAQAEVAATSKVASFGMLGFGRALSAMRTGLFALALNPITIGLLALTAAVAGTLIYFDKMKKMQQEIEDIEERSYKNQLKRLQAQVMSIKNKKAATVSLKEYIDDLEIENHLMSLGETERTKEIADTRALEIAKRDLLPAEQARLDAALRMKDAVKAKNAVAQEELAVLASIKEPQQAYAHMSEILNSLEDKGKITIEEKTKALDALGQKYGGVSGDSFQQYLDGLREETRLLKLSTAEQASQRAIAAATGKKGSKLTGDEAKTVKDVLVAKQVVGSSGYLAGLAEENRLLTLNTKEQEIQRALVEIKSASGGKLAPGTEDKVRVLFAERDALRDVNYEKTTQRQLLEDILGPQKEYEDTLSRINDLASSGKLNDEQKAKAIAQLKDMYGKVSLEAEATAKVMDSVWQSASSAIDEFVNTGKLDFQKFTFSLISDINKILLKMLLLKTVKAAAGMVDIGGFAAGGSFTVGGSGGTDSQLVAFKATPGEQVTVRTPTQQAPAQTPSRATPIINIFNVSNPNEVTDIMSGSEGEQIIVNVVSRNKENLRQVGG